MKSLLSFLVLFFAIGITFVFSQSDTVQLLSPNHFNRVLQLNPDVELIDVSSKRDFKKGHIKGAHLAENSEDLYRLIDSLGTSKVYLLYCKCGERSIDAGKMIYEKYKISVCSLEGGLEAWLQEGKDVY